MLIDCTFNFDETIRESIAARILKRIPENREYLHNNLTMALRMMKEHGKLYALLLEKTMITLRQITANEPQVYKDFTRPLFKEGLDKIIPGIERFMKSPTHSVFRYKAIKDERSRAQRSFSSANLDLKYTTERTRPSHTLVMTKTNASYFRALKQYQDDVELLKKMEKLE